MKNACKQHSVLDITSSSYADCRESKTGDPKFKELRDETNFSCYNRSCEAVSIHKARMFNEHTATQEAVMV